MKTISNKLFAALTSIAFGMSVAAQESATPQVGFVRIVNAVAAGTDKANIYLDGEDLFPKGYGLGQKTSGLGIKAGRHRVDVRKPGVETGTAQIDLAVGETVSLIAFAERVAVDRASDPPRWAVQLLRLKQRAPERGYQLSVLSVCAKPEVAVQAAVQGQGKVEALVARRLEISILDLGTARGEVLVRTDRGVIATISPDDPGNYVLILYEDADGTVRGISYFDPKFTVAG